MGIHEYMIGYLVVVCLGSYKKTTSVSCLYVPRQTRHHYSLCVGKDTVRSRHFINQ